ncbi:MAG: Gfo/Idh/MocA family oxidoreductase [Abditibacteriales bacterium]|nr:Gfo/Idh/MocA family oxidoreductase [Abditibacteriales bacterium]
MAQKVRVGIIGAGGIARSRHLPGLKKIAGVEVVVACSRTRETVEQFAREFGIPEVETDWRKVVERTDLDAVFIAAPPILHATATVAALEAGKHVFCQARMARNVAEAQQMLERARQAPSLVTMLCPSPVGMRVDRFLKKLIADGYLGRLLTVHATGFNASYADPHAPLHWRQSAEMSGVNTLALGIWVEPLHRWFGTFKRVVALSQIHTPQRRDAKTGEMKPVETADTLGVVGEMRNGALATLHFSGVAQCAPENRFEFYGSEGTIVYNLDRDELLGARVGEKTLTVLPVPAEMERSWTVEADFIAAVRGEAVDTLNPTFEQGLRYMELTEAVVRSAQTGQVVEINEA